MKKIQEKVIGRFRPKSYHELNDCLSRIEEIIKSQSLENEITAKQTNEKLKTLTQNTKNIEQEINTIRVKVLNIANNTIDQLAIVNDYFNTYSETLCSMLLNVFVLYTRVEKIIALGMTNSFTSELKEKSSQAKKSKSLANLGKEKFEKLEQHYIRLKSDSEKGDNLTELTELIELMGNIRYSFQSINQYSENELKSIEKMQELINKSWKQMFFIKQ